MSCNKSAGGGHGYNVRCGDRVYGENSLITMCDKCKDNLIRKLCKDIDMGTLNKKEYAFVLQLLYRSKSAKISINLDGEVTMSSSTPQEQFEALDKATKEIFEKEDLIKSIYSWIKKLEYIPESHFITNTEQFSKIEALIDEIRREG